MVTKRLQLPLTSPPFPRGELGCCCCWLLGELAVDTVEVAETGLFKLLWLLLEVGTAEL
jgi:hypothetical protein